MAARRFAGIMGIAFTLVGLLGFTTSHLFGLHTLPAMNVVHLAVGVIGLFAAFHEGLAWVFARWTGLLFLIMAVLAIFVPGLLPGLPMGAADAVLHFIAGAIALYVGYVIGYEAEQAGHARPARPLDRRRGRSGTRGMR